MKASPKSVQEYCALEVLDVIIIIIIIIIITKIGCMYHCMITVAEPVSGREVDI